MKYYLRFAVFLASAIIVVIAGSIAYKARIASTWNIYQNSRYGFELRYPPQWVVSTSPQEIYPLIAWFIQENRVRSVRLRKPIVQLHIEDNRDHKLLVAFLKDAGYPVDESAQIITVAGEQGVRFGPNTTDVFTSLQHNEHVLTFEAEILGSNDQRTVDEMLSTLHFVR